MSPTQGKQRIFRKRTEIDLGIQKTENSLVDGIHAENAGIQPQMTLKWKSRTACQFGRKAKKWWQGPEYPLLHQRTQNSPFNCHFELKYDGYDRDFHSPHNFQKMAQNGAFLEESGAKVAQGKTIIKPHTFEQI